MPDPFASFTPGLESPASAAFAITPSDSTDLPQVTRALNVAQTGTVALVTVRGDTATVFVAAGIAFPIRAQRVLATGTSATGIVGLS